MTAILILISALFAGALQAEEVKLDHHGLTLNAELEKVEGNWPAGPVVLMVHGTLAHNGMEIITTLQELFAENGISSLAINLSLGLNDRHGMYDCKVPHHHRHTAAVDEIGVWLGWLKAQGARRVVLLGHSRGGNQVAWFAAEHDDPAVSHVVLVAPALWSPEYAAEDYRKRYGKALAPVLARAQKLVAGGKAGTIMQPVDFIYCKDTSATTRAFVSYYAPDPRRDTAYLIPKIPKPVLVFAGTEDNAVKGLEAAVKPLADDSKVKLVVMDGADHFFRDLYAEDVVETTLEFIGDDS